MADVMLFRDKYFLLSLFIALQPVDIDDTLPVDGSSDAQLVFNYTPPVDGLSDAWQDLLKDWFFCDNKSF